MPTKPTGTNQQMSTSMLPDRLTDFQSLTTIQLTISDFDAEHPVWLYLIKKNGIPKKEAIWFSFLYMAFYDEASAWVTFKAGDVFKVPTNTELPIDKNRRNLYGTGIDRHLTSLCEHAEISKDWPCHNFVGDPKKDWDILKENIRSVWGNGRFGAYTTAEMLQKVNGIPVEVTDFDNQGSSGPADGIRRLYGITKGHGLNMDHLAEGVHNEILKHISKNSIESGYTRVDRGVTESLLCNFSGCSRGKFYLGRNLDRQQGRIRRVELMGHRLPMLWEARKAVYRQEDLGEFNGWVGIDKDRLKSYLTTDRMLWPSEDR